MWVVLEATSVAETNCVSMVISSPSCTSVWVVFSIGFFRLGAVGHGGVCSGSGVWSCVACSGSEQVCHPHTLWVIKFREEGFVGAVS